MTSCFPLPVKGLFFLTFFFTSTLFCGGQLVHETFTETIFSDDFSSDKGNWEVQSNADNLFLIQDKEYLLRRMNTEAEAAIFCTWKNTCPVYELTATLKIEKGQDSKGYAGLLFMIQDDKSGGFLFEINAKKQYRIRQLVHANFKLITGNAQNKGWVASSAVREAGTFNEFRVAYSDKNYDLYLNGTLMKSFTELAYKNGSFGFMIGPASTAHVDAIKMNSLDCSQAEPVKKEVPLTNVPVDTAVLVNQLQNEIRHLRLEVKTLRDSLSKKK
jgi:hypothetical protein